MCVGVHACVPVCTSALGSRVSVPGSLGFVLCDCEKQWMDTAGGAPGTRRLMIMTK